MGIRTDLVQGQDLEQRKLIAFVFLACVFAFVIGIVIDVSILAAFAEEGGIVIVLDVMTVPFWTVALVVVGTVFGNTALRTGWFGLITWTLGAILVVATVSLLVFLVQIGGLRDFATGRVAEQLFWPVHEGVLFGGVAGLLFWKRVVRIRPDLLSKAVNKAAALRKTGVAVGFVCIACWLAVVAAIVWAWFA